jgi:hypothetical protein
MNPFNGPLTAVSCSWVNNLEYPGFPPQDSSPYGENEIMRREEFVKRQLDKSTKGLLEIVETRYDFWDPSEPQISQKGKAWKVVQFLHRTCRDFLRERLQDEHFLKLFSMITPGEIYGRIRLSELNYRCPAHMIPGDHLWGVYLVNGMYMLSPANRKKSNGLFGLPPALADRFRLTSQGAGFYTIGWNIRCENKTMEKPEEASFLHLAAGSGHEEYVLGKLQDDQNLLNDRDGDLSIELSALGHERTRLASQILKYGGSVHRQIQLHRAIPSKHDQLSDIKTIPLWMIVVYAAVSRGTRYALENDEDVSRGAIALWEFFLQHILSSLVADEMRCEISIIGEAKSYISLGDLLPLLARQYSSLIVSECMNQECWRVVGFMPTITDQAKHHKYGRPHNEAQQMDDIPVLNALMQRRMVQFEVKNHEYVMNNDWCFRTC